MKLEMDPDLFAQVGDIVHSICGDELSDLPELRMSNHRYGIKVWFGEAQPTRGHYEAQLLRRKKVDGKEGMWLEIGFHSEHPKVEQNEAELEVLLAKEKSWRKALGPEPTAGEFFDADVWRRLSDVWFNPDLTEPDTALEIAGRLSDYLLAFEPIRQAAANS